MKKIPLILALISTNLIWSFGSHPSYTMEEKEKKEKAGGKTTLIDKPETVYDPSIGPREAWERLSSADKNNMNFLFGFLDQMAYEEVVGRFEMSGAMSLLDRLGEGKENKAKDQEADELALSFALQSSLKDKEKEDLARAAQNSLEDSNP